VRVAGTGRYEAENAEKEFPRKGTVLAAGLHSVSRNKTFNSVKTQVKPNI